MDSHIHGNLNSKNVGDRCYTVFISFLLYYYITSITNYEPLQLSLGGRWGAGFAHSPTCRVSVAVRRAAATAAAKTLAAAASAAATAAITVTTAASAAKTEAATRKGSHSTGRDTWANVAARHQEATATHPSSAKKTRQRRQHHGTVIDENIFERQKACQYSCEHL